MRMFLIGKIVKTHGIKGEVKIDSYTDFDRFKVGNEVLINHQSFKIKSVRTQNELLLVSFEGLLSLNDVIFLHGQEVFTDKEVSIDSDDEFHLPSLIDRKVYTDDLVYVGLVKYVIDVPQGHLLEIYNDDDKKILIPFVKAFIKEVTKDKIIITPIEGLI